MRPRVEAFGENDAGFGGIHGFADVPRMDDLAAVVKIFRHPGGRDRHQESARHSERRSLRPGKGKGTHSGLSGGQETSARHEGTHPLLRRTSGRGQNFAGEIDRSGHGPQVRAHLAWRDAR